MVIYFGEMGLREEGGGNEEGEGEGEGEGMAYSEFNGDGEVVTSSLFGDGFTAFNAGKVDECGCDDAFLAGGGFENLFGEAMRLVGQ